MSVATPREDLYVVAVQGVLDRILSTRLLRLVDARVRISCVHRRATKHLVVDLCNVPAVGRGGLELLEHARHATDAHGLSLHLVAPDPQPWPLSRRARELVSRVGVFSSVDEALRLL
ncbi:STAS domain-containing protein [Pseudonocardia sp. RS010]|uniref:STAS domain-containing protein n=1 Tax=Pseudonocardia sp. RS010 TaxID=3385979 RepID=UPI00399F04BB